MYPVCNRVKWIMSSHLNSMQIWWVPVTGVSTMRIKKVLTFDLWPIRVRCWNVPNNHFKPNETQLISTRFKNQEFALKLAGSCSNRASDGFVVFIWCFIHMIYAFADLACTQWRRRSNCLSGDCLRLSAISSDCQLLCEIVRIIWVYATCTTYLYNIAMWSTWCGKI